MTTKRCILNLDTTVLQQLHGTGKVVSASMKTPGSYNRGVQTADDEPSRSISQKGGCYLELRIIHISRVLRIVMDRT